MDEQRLDRIKRLAVIGVFSDDMLLDRLVLKGGNALDLVHRVSTRASVDIDFSMEHGWDSAELEEVRHRIESRLRQAFGGAGYTIFDVRMDERPEQVTPDLADFWGGYQLEFKVIGTAVFEQLGGNVDAIRRQAQRVGPQNRTKLELQISKHEFCRGKQQVDFEGYTIHVYTPAMVVCEKLRAICQQLPVYARFVKKHAAPRARDFLDIHDTVARFTIDIATNPNRELLTNIFAAKRVPIALLGQIRGVREFHRLDWAAVQATIRPGVELRPFDYYFDFVVGLVERLKTAGHV